MDSYLILKFFHILGVTTFMGGTLSSWLTHRQLVETGGPIELAAVRQMIRRIDMWAITSGAWLLFFAGMTAALMAGVAIYHSFWVMVGFTLFLIQAGLAHAAVRINRKFLSGDEKNWQRETRCQIYLLVNLVIGVITIFLMTTKFSL